MSDQLRECPFYKLTCNEAREALRKRGRECEFASALKVPKPPAIIGAPPQIERIEMCKLHSIQLGINGLNDGMQQLQAMVNALLQPGKKLPDLIVRN